MTKLYIMKGLFFFIVCVSLIKLPVEVVAEIKLEEIKQPEPKKQLYTDKIYETDEEGLKVVHDTFKNVVLWVYTQEDEQIFANLEASLKLMNAEENKIDVIFVKSEISKLQDYKEGLHIKHYTENQHKDSFQLLTPEQLKDEILSFVCPSVNKIELEEVEQYLSGEHVKLLLVMESSHKFFDKVKGDFEHALKDGALLEAGVVGIRQLDSPQYKDFKQPSLLLYKPNYPLVRYDNNITYFDQINDFINLESLPLVIPLNSMYYARVFGGSVNTQLHLLIDESRHEILVEYEQASQNNKENDLRYHRLLFTHSNFEDNKDLWTQFDFNEHTKLPQIVITKTNFRKFQMEKYIYDHETINATLIGDFLEQFRENNLTQFYRSEDVPQQDSNDLIIKVVGKTFIQEILKGRQNTAILFWDSKNANASRTHEAVLRSIAEELPEDKREFLKIVTFDLALNEHPSITIDTCPQIYLYLAADKRRPKDYDFRLDVTEDQIKAWLSNWISDLELVRFKPDGGYTVVDLVQYKEEKRLKAEQFALKQAILAEKQKLIDQEEYQKQLESEEKLLSTKQQQTSQEEQQTEQEQMEEMQELEKQNQEDL